MDNTLVDSHAHAWETWPYLPKVPDAATRGSVELLIHEMDQNDVAQAVVIAAGIEENRDNNDYVARAVQRFPDRLHHFADVDCIWHADYHTAGAAARLEHHADQYSLKGFTHYVQNNDGWFRSAEGLEFFRVAAERGLIASLAMTPEWAQDLAVVLDDNPTLVVLLHHMGVVQTTSPKAELAKVTELAKYPNVYIKLSGFHYAVGLDERGWDFPHLDAMWIAEGLYRAFGPKRMCWASDFPALSRVMTYRQSIEIVRTHCKFIDPNDLNDIFGGTMARLLMNAAR